MTTEPEKRGNEARAWEEAEWLVKWITEHYLYASSKCGCEIGFDGKKQIFLTIQRVMDAKDQALKGLRTAYDSALASAANWSDKALERLGEINRLKKALNNWTEHGSAKEIADLQAQLARVEELAGMNQTKADHFDEMNEQRQEFLHAKHDLESQISKLKEDFAEVDRQRCEAENNYARRASEIIKLQAVVEAARDLTVAAKAEFNERGAGGYAFARLDDMRDALRILDGEP